MKIRTVNNEEQWLELCEELRLRGKNYDPETSVMFHFNESSIDTPHDWDKEYLLIVKDGNVEKAEYTPRCSCECHKKDVQVMHFMACCDLTYEKYLDKDGTVDYEVYNKLRAKRYQDQKQKAGGDNMEKLNTLKERLAKAGITVEFAANYPWIYLTKINGIQVTETYQGNHGFTIGFLPAKKDVPFLFTDLKEIFKIIRKYRYQS